MTLDTFLDDAGETVAKNDVLAKKLNGLEVRSHFDESYQNELVTQSAEKIFAVCMLGMTESASSEPSALATIKQKLIEKKGPAHSATLKTMHMAGMKFLQGLKPSAQDQDRVFDNLPKSVLANIKNWGMQENTHKDFANQDGREDYINDLLESFGVKENEDYSLRNAQDSTPNPSG
ncbi:hypothetical protein [Candidatus Synchoanobacter obligatus]|uniref:Uncharacterized protein n=1 Tax=Candidatus Synchoanobacter obligatus TaxID=2919597 RepID=A0ABT1L6M9_9GAMM|nr:hypothetical protein [Candidatus Synchoanobacter obligatus]MCP8352518.1 hypothetical protein [Candidatus Synchoanobacter obligatus]